MSLRKLASSRAWKKAHPERHAELARAYRARNKEKTKAQNQLNYALMTGKMVRGSCEKCGTSERVHAHHHDYSKPYDVRWLCYLCHKAEHPVSEADKQIKFVGAKQGNAHGTDNPNAKLTDSDVRKIRAMLKLGLSQTQIAAAFGVCQGTISDINLGERWKHVKD